MSAGSALIVSLDFELGWGVLDHPAWRQRESDGLYRRMREVLARVHEFQRSQLIRSDLVARLEELYEGAAPEVLG